MFGKKKIPVNAILDSDVEKLLRETALYEDLMLAKLKCQSCNVSITIENIGVIIPKVTEGKINLEFYCEKINCMEEYKQNGHI